jgi:hypothetical protein
LALLLLLAGGLPAAETGGASDEPWLRPDAGPTRADVDATTLDGKVLCGYQGWFNTPGDGTGFGFTHWGEGLDRTSGGRFTVDMWPDLSEYAPEDLREVPGLKMPDGSPARLYSAFRKGPVLLHCQWMRHYGIDGVFLSRFIGEAANPSRSRHVNQVLANVREGCHREGRVWAKVYGMFDEVDEGTAIYKVANATPVGKYFVTYEGLPSDWYLTLTGAATRMIRGEAPLSETMPEPLPFPRE